VCACVLGATQVIAQPVACRVPLLQAAFMKAVNMIVAEGRKSGGRPFQLFFVATGWL
jgi:hypothetical protein